MNRAKTRLISNILKIYSNEYFIGPIIMSFICYILLTSSWSSNFNFDIINSFFSFLIYISTLLMIFSLYRLTNKDQEFSIIFALSFFSMIFSLFSLMFYKTFSIFHSVFLPISLIAIFLFFWIFKEIFTIIANIGDETKKDNVSLEMKKIKIG